VLLSTLSNPAFISRNREETFTRGLCRVLMSLVRVRHASWVLCPGSEPHWLGCNSPQSRAAASRQAAMILSRTFEIVRIRTIILKEEADL